MLSLVTNNRMSLVRLQLNWLLKSSPSNPRLQIVEFSNEFMCFATQSMSRTTRAP
jgi:hypothetical protein